MYSPNPFSIMSQLQPQVFRTDLNAAKLVHQRLDACDRAFELDDIRFIRSSINALEHYLLMQKMVNDSYLHRLTKLEADQAEKSRIATLEYQKRKAKAIIPGNVPKPLSIPPLDYWREKYIILLDQCQAKEMLFRESKKDHHNKPKEQLEKKNLSKDKKYDELAKKKSVRLTEQKSKPGNHQQAAKQ